MVCIDFDTIEMISCSYKLSKRPSVAVTITSPSSKSIRYLWEQIILLAWSLSRCKTIKLQEELVNYKFLSPSFQDKGGKKFKISSCVEQKLTFWKVGWACNDFNTTYLYKFWGIITSFNLYWKIELVNHWWWSFKDSTISNYNKSRVANVGHMESLQNKNVKA